MPIPPPATTCPLAPRRWPSAICHPPAAAVPATSISRVQAPASETSARQSSEYGLLLRPSFVCEGMAVERAARWATPASSIYAAAAGDEQADLGVARVGFSELQSLEQQQRLPLFLCARAGHSGGFGSPGPAPPASWINGVECSDYGDCRRLPRSRRR